MRTTQCLEKEIATVADLQEFYRKNFGRQVSTIARHLKYNKDLAEDVVQESYLRAQMYADSFDPEKGAFNAWFNKIMFNVLKDTQKEYGYTTPLNDNIPANEEGLEFLLILDEEVSELKNQQTRRVIELFYRNGYSSNQISKQEGLTRSNVTTICSRFRKQLKEKYGLSL
jgi:RNA polymerase sigma factor (sigma-70 family)